jgi:hypothetical protein
MSQTWETRSANQKYPTVRPGENRSFRRIPATSPPRHQSMIRHRSGPTLGRSTNRTRRSRRRLSTCGSTTRAATRRRASGCSRVRDHLHGFSAALFGRTHPSPRNRSPRLLMFRIVADGVLNGETRALFARTLFKERLKNWRWRGRREARSEWKVGTTEARVCRPLLACLHRHSPFRSDTTAVLAAICGGP